MCDLLHLTLQRLEMEPPIFYAREVRRHLSQHLDELVRLGILQATSHSGFIDCIDCGSRLRLEYVIDDVTQTPQGYATCPSCGVMEVHPEQTRRWLVDAPGLLTALFGAGGVECTVTKVLPGCLWRVGKAIFADRAREVLFANPRLSADPAAIVEQVGKRRAAILFVPTDRAVAEWSGPPERSVIALESVASLRDGAIHFDTNFVEGQLRSAEPSPAKKQKPPAKRAPRTEKIERIRNELIRHINAARAYAKSEEDSTGVPKLLPRPTQKELAKRVGLTETAVSNCLNDESATELRVLWDVADDLDEIMKWTGPIRPRRESDD